MLMRPEVISPFVSKIFEKVLTDISLDKQLFLA